ncbi:hypothetical protein [Peterkaempfera sp. SMS 1(5)a]|uniref:hypothetical protein n=1 Tax=Peterkaempfera podocarpi TaxID=3232308 RepID=UPI0036702320
MIVPRAWRRYQPPWHRATAAAATLLGLLLLTAMPVLADSGAPARADSGSATVQGRQAWDPATQALRPDPMEVTVRQAGDLTHEVVHLSWKNFTPSSGTSGGFSTATVYPVAVMQCRGSDPQMPLIEADINYVPGVPSDCILNTQVGGTTADGRNNLVWTVTGADGTGEADIEVLTRQESAFLGCGPTVPCSLVVEPIQGGYKGSKANPTKYPMNCADHHLDGISSVISTAGGFGYYCNWSQHITIPLTFRQSTLDCPAADSDFSMAGSPMFGTAADLWTPGYCKGSGDVQALHATFNSSLDEYQARSTFLSGAQDVGLTSQPAAASATSTRTYTYAPIANTAIVLAYAIDDPVTGKPVTGLKLNARLVAKLLTQSYSGGVTCPAVGSYVCSPGVGHNPASVMDDPEFQQLNPGLPTTAMSNQGRFGSFPVVLYGRSDMTYELTRWVTADPDARAFLKGKSDPWGMRINAGYVGVHYPLEQFSKLDLDGDLQWFWNPVSSYAELTQYPVQGKTSAQNTWCTPDPAHPDRCTHTAVPPVGPGARSIIAVMGMGDAAKYRYPVAALENAAGQFVEPTPGSMSAGVDAMTVDEKSGALTADIGATDPKAYPLTEPVVAMVPTSGVASAKAGKIADWLGYAAGPGQTYGTAPGDLPDGYQALSDRQAAQTVTAAQHVRAQDGAEKVPPPPPGSTSGGSSSGGSSGGSAAASGGSAVSGGGTSSSGIPVSGGTSLGGTTSAGTAAGGTSGGASGGTASSGGAAGGSGNTSKGAASGSTTAGLPAAPIAAGTPSADQAGAMRWMLPVLLIVGGVLLVGGPTALVLGRTGQGTVLLARARSWYGRLRARILTRRSG